MPLVVNLLSPCTVSGPVFCSPTAKQRLLDGCALGTPGALRRAQLPIPSLFLFVRPTGWLFFSASFATGVVTANSYS